jgi:hypothetical protein
MAFRIFKRRLDGDTRNMPLPAGLQMIFKTYSLFALGILTPAVAPEKRRKCKALVLCPSFWKNGPRSAITRAAVIVSRAANILNDMWPSAAA